MPERVAIRSRDLPPERPPHVGALGWEALVLFHGGVSYDDLAARLNVSKVTAKQRVRSAVLRLETPPAPRRYARTPPPGKPAQKRPAPTKRELARKMKRYGFEGTRAHFGCGTHTLRRWLVERGLRDPK